MKDVYVFNNFFSALKAIMDRFGVKSIECMKVELSDNGLIVNSAKIKNNNSELVLGDLPRIVVKL